MRKLLEVLLLLIIANMANAETTVKSGEHPGFTRIVVDYGRDVKWEVRRIENGYALSIDASQEEFDLSHVFDVINKKRIREIHELKNSATLILTLNCKCGVISFELRSGIVVLDVSESFQSYADRREVKINELDNQIIETNEKYLTNALSEWWRIDQRSNLTFKNGIDWFELSADNTILHRSLDVARSENEARTGYGIIEGMSRAASSGTIDLSRSSTELRANSNFPLVNAVDNLAISSDKSYNMIAVRTPSGGAKLTPKGDICIPADHVDVSSWKSADPVYYQLGVINEGMIGEFDAPISNSALGFAKFLIAIGFGAEARQVAQSFARDAPNVEIIFALSYLVDGDEDPSHYFRDQLKCDSPSALWSLLSESNFQKQSEVNSDAVFLAFSELDLQTRKHLGPRLAAELISRGEVATAAKIRDAILRSEFGPGSEEKLIGSQIDTYYSNPSEAEKKARAAFAIGGSDAWKALVSVVEARAAQNLPIERDTLLALEAIAREHAGTESGATMSHALILAYALVGDFSSAFENLSKNSEVELDLWRLLSQIGSDDDLLTYATLPAGSDFPRVDGPTRYKIVDRLMNLGMKESSMRWTSDSESPDAIKLGRMRLQQQDYGSALNNLANDQSTGGNKLKAFALRGAGDGERSADLFSSTRQIGEGVNSLRVSRDLPEVAKMDRGAWKDAAVALNDSDQPSDGVLQTGYSLLAKSGDTRSIVESLLNLKRR